MVISYIINVKVDHIIRIMLEHHNSTAKGVDKFTEKILDQIQSKASDLMETLIEKICQAAFTSDEETWLDILKINLPKEEHFE